MQFNPDVNKQAVEVIFSCKRNKPAHPPKFFNDIIVKQLPKHKHLGLILDSKLTFDKHIQESITKARKGIGVIRFMSKYRQRNVLDQLYKGSVIFYQEGGGAPENWGDQVLCLRSKGGSKDFFKLKRGDHLYFLKK